MGNCSKCKHKGVCKYESDMQKFQEEIADKNRILEYQNFKTTIQCNFFSDESMPILLGKR